ncbi:MAG: DnaD domain protein [Paeniclostridium sp.]
MELINEYNLTPDLVVYAYEYSKEQKRQSKTSVNYVESVLRDGMMQI